jgi:hypothetical protein
MAVARMMVGLLAALMLPAMAVRAADAPGQIAVMTQNQYLGADLAPLLSASSPAGLNDALLKMLRQAAANHFRTRVERQVAQIQARQPHLVGLQEVFHLGCRDLPPRRGACSDPSIAGAFIDQLSATVAALQAQGAPYVVAARVVNFDLRDIGLNLPGIGDLQGIPFTIDNRLGLLTAYDQDVILARRDVVTRPVVFAGCRRSAQGCNYRAEIGVPMPLSVGSRRIGVKRGFVAVDASHLGRSYRFVNTHLEVDDLQPAGAAAAVQAAQAAELLRTLRAAPMPAGRAPSDQPPAPLVSPYRRFVAAGFVDSWAAEFGASGGFTCCQAADLRNDRSQLYERVDLIFAMQPVLVEAVRLDGRTVTAKTPPIGGQRLWPSDHAGVAARLRF